MMNRSLAFTVAITLVIYPASEICAMGKQYRPKGKAVVHIERAAPITENLAWDLSIGGSIYEANLHELDRNGITVDSQHDLKLVERLNRIMAKLRPQTQMPDLPYQVHLVDSDISNAACYPGGNIVFFKGIFDADHDGLVDQGNDDEIAAVMAHEMSHAALRHTYKTIRVAERADLIVKIAMIAAGTVGGPALQSLLSKAFNVAANLIFPKYSRTHEEEADLEGAYVALAAGFKPEASVDLWKRAMERGGRNAMRTGLFASHPSNRHRMETLERKIRAIRGQGGVK